MIFFITHIVALALSVSVTGPTECPLVSDVQAIFNTSSSAKPAEQLNQVEVTMLAGNAMQIDLSNPQGATLATKIFVEPYTCAERAHVVAVFATTWDAATAIESVLPDVALDEPAMQVEPPRPRPIADNSVVAAATPPPQPWTLRLGAGLAGVSGAVLEAQGLGFVAEFEARPAPRWGIKTELYGLPSRQRDLGPGQAVWSRYGVGLGLRAWRPQGFGALTFDMTAHLASTMVKGEGFSVNTNAGAVVPGAKLAIGVDWVVSRPLHIAADLGVLVWSRRETIAAVGPAEVWSEDLPRADLLLRLLFAWENIRP